MSTFMSVAVANLHNWPCWYLNFVNFTSLLPTQYHSLLRKYWLCFLIHLTQVSLPDWSYLKWLKISSNKESCWSWLIHRFVFHLLEFYQLYRCCLLFWFPQNFKSEVLLFLWSLTQNQVRNFECVGTMQAIVIFSTMLNNVFPNKSGKLKWCQISPPMYRCESTPEWIAVCLNQVKAETDWGNHSAAWIQWTCWFTKSYALSGILTLL